MMSSSLALAGLSVKADESSGGSASSDGSLMEALGQHTQGFDTGGSAAAAPPASKRPRLELSTLMAAGMLSLMKSTKELVKQNKKLHSVLVEQVEKQRSQTAELHSALVEQHSLLRGIGESVEGLKSASAFRHLNMSSLTQSDFCAVLADFQFTVYVQYWAIEDAFTAGPNGWPDGASELSQHEPVRSWLQASVVNVLSSQRATVEAATSRHLQTVQQLPSSKFVVAGVPDGFVKHDACSRIMSSVEIKMPTTIAAPESLFQASMQSVAVASEGGLSLHGGLGLLTDGSTSITVLESKRWVDATGRMAGALTLHVVGSTEKKVRIRADELQGAFKQHRKASLGQHIQLAVLLLDEAAERVASTSAHGGAGTGGRSPGSSSGGSGGAGAGRGSGGSGGAGAGSSSSGAGAGSSSGGSRDKGPGSGGSSSKDGAGAGGGSSGTGGGGGGASHRGSSRAGALPARVERGAAPSSKAYAVPSSAIGTCGLESSVGGLHARTPARAEFTAASAAFGMKPLEPAAAGGAGSAHAATNTSSAIDGSFRKRKRGGADYPEDAHMSVQDDSAAPTLALSHQEMPSTNISPASSELSLINIDGSTRADSAGGSPAGSEDALLAQASAKFYERCWTEAVDHLNAMLRYQGTSGIQFNY